eukprot:764089-Hanusia_phi.AAC.1
MPRKRNEPTDAGVDTLTEHTTMKCRLRHQIQDQEPILFKTLEKCSDTFQKPEISHNELNRLIRCCFTITSANTKFPILNEYWRAKGHLHPPLQWTQGVGQCITFAVNEYETNFRNQMVFTMNSLQRKDVRRLLEVYENSNEYKIVLAKINNWTRHSKFSQDDLNNSYKTIII